MKKAIVTNQAPNPVGPYSQAVESNGFLFCSGQISINPTNEKVLTGPIEEQTKQVLENIRAVLTAAQLDLSHVVKTTIFLINMNDFPVVNEIYARYFEAPYPARSTIAVSALPKGVHVEIEVVAERR